MSYAHISVHSPATTLRSGSSLAASLRARLREWHQRSRSRAELLELSDEQLLDVGISREQALAEAHKPFWVC